MKLVDLKEQKSPYFVMDISHEPGDKIQVHVLNSDVQSDDYHIQVFVNEKTWEVVQVAGYDAKSDADVVKDTAAIVAAVNAEFKKHKDLKQVKLAANAKIG